jgi:hypothetical protein
MSYRVSVTCDQCGQAVVLATDLRQRMDLPPDWQRHGTADFCSWRCLSKWAKRQAIQTAPPSPDTPDNAGATAPPEPTRQ